jgi:hypothetical protein
MLVQKSKLNDANNSINREEGFQTKFQDRPGLCMICSGVDAQRGSACQMLTASPHAAQFTNRLSFSSVAISQQLCRAEPNETILDATAMQRLLIALS